MLQSIRAKNRNPSVPHDSVDEREDADDVDLGSLRLPETMPDNTRDATAFLRRQEEWAIAYVESSDIRNLIKIAQIRDHSFDAEDVCQEARIGLFIALCKYDSQKGALFETYAYYWMRQRVMRFLLNRGIVRTPAKVKHTIAEFRRIVARWEEDARMGRTDVSREEAIARWIRTEKINEELLVAGLIVHTTKTMMLSHPLRKKGEGGNERSAGFTLEEVIPDDSLMTARHLLTNVLSLETKSFVSTMVGYAGLSRSEEELLFCRYGFSGNQDGETLDQLGARYGVSGEAIRRRVNKILDKLRAAYLEEMDEGIAERSVE